MKTKGGPVGKMLALFSDLELSGQSHLSARTVARVRSGAYSIGSWQARAVLRAVGALTVHTWDAWPSGLYLWQIRRVVDCPIRGMLGFSPTRGQCCHNFVEATCLDEAGFGHPCWNCPEGSRQRKLDADRFALDDYDMGDVPSMNAVAQCAAVLGVEHGGASKAFGPGGHPG